MKFSQFAGCTIVPSLSRLVLALVFVTAGYNKLFTEATFDLTPDQMDALGRLKVTMTPVSVPTASAAGTIGLASFLQDEPADAGGGEGEAEEAIEAAIDELPDSIADPAGAGNVQYTGKSVHKVTLLCIDEGWPFPHYMAWVAGITELVGGGLLLIGLFSRVWGLGLSIAMGVAFYLVGVPMLTDANITDPLTLARLMSTNPAEGFQIFGTVSGQVAFFLLAFGIFLTGPGPISIDRLLFGRRGGDGVHTIQAESSEQLLAGRV